MPLPNSNTEFSRYKVLIVDDERFHRMLLREVLENLACEVIDACDGEEALQIIQTTDVDIVLLDHTMPGISGYEVCQRIRGELDMPLLPVIMVTGNSSVEHQKACLDAGATDFISKPYNPTVLRARVNAALQHKRLLNNLDNAENILFTLAYMVEARDKSTGDHCKRLGHISSVFGRKLGVSSDELESLRRGSVLHDIGKLAVPDSILLKQGPLSRTEWEHMRQHTVIGAELCSQLPSMNGASTIIRHHHEKWNGSGYPDKLSGTNIPFLARLFQIIDIYDALNNERPYKRAFTTDEIIDVLEKETEAGCCDPEMAPIFIDLIKRSPQELAGPDTLGRSSGPEMLQNLLTGTTIQ